MRLDKYLKVARLIKRRTVANVVADNGNILVNSKVAKPSTDIKINDIIELNLGKHYLKVVIKQVRDISSVGDSSDMYEVIDNQIKEDKI
jgi:ribosomal 50S subunit-recycling heat shock protein